MAKFELFGFVFAHIDQCPLCQVALCEEGKALIARAAEIGAQCFVPDYPIEKPKTQA